MEIKVQAKFVKTSPKKLRLLTTLIKGMQLDYAIAQLNFLNRQNKHELTHLLKSAAASAKEQGISSDTLFVKIASCDQGPSLKRMIYGSKGRSSRIKKRMSHLYVTISDKKDKDSKKKELTKADTKKAEK